MIRIKSLRMTRIGVIEMVRIDLHPPVDISLIS